jgi:hypothetical protein
MNKLNINENFYYTNGKAKLNNSSKNGKTIYNNIIDKEKFKIKSENNQKKNKKNPVKIILLNVYLKMRIIFLLTLIKGKMSNLNHLEINLICQMI